MSLPSFKKPPVVETVLGAQFDRLSGFTNAHLGLFWALLKQNTGRNGLEDNWIGVADMAAIEPSFEQFPESGGWARLGGKIRFSRDPASRLQIRNGANTRMVQVQNGRLHLNWTRTGDSEYVRYARLRPEFEELLSGFERLLVNEQLGVLRPNQWEVTYVNQLLRGREWHNPEDWCRLFRSLPGVPAQPMSGSLETFDSTWHFELPPQTGRLHIEIRHVRLGDVDGQEALQLSLTARGPASTTQDILIGLDRGRAAIVTAFAECTSNFAQDHWERE